MPAVYRDSLKEVKKDAKKAARDLGYGKAVLARLDAAKTEGEVSNIMVNARKEKFG